MGRGHFLKTQKFQKEAAEEGLEGGEVTPAMAQESPCCWVGTQRGSQWGASWKGLGLSPQGESSISVPEDWGLRPYESVLVTAAKERIPIPAAVLGRARQGRAGRMADFLPAALTKTQRVCV